MTKNERLEPIGEARDHVERAIEAIERHDFIEENKNMANELRLAWNLLDSLYVAVDAS